MDWRQVGSWWWRHRLGFYEVRPGIEPTVHRHRQRRALEPLHSQPGGGDNLFLSIVALNPDNGEYVWHYQTTPGDTWDYTATQHMILADIEINQEPRKVNTGTKNGFSM